MTKTKIAQLFVASLGIATALQASTAAACEKELKFPRSLTDGITCKDVVNGVTVASGDNYEGISISNSTRYRASARLRIGSIAFTIIRDDNRRQINDCYAEDRNATDSAGGSKQCTANFVSQGKFVSVYAAR